MFGDITVAICTIIAIASEIWVWKIEQGDDKL